MDLTPHVTNLSRALAVAGTAGGEEAEAFLERFAVPLESAIRLTFLEVVSEAAEEISAGLQTGSVDVRLRGSNPGFVVTMAPQAEETPESIGEPASPPGFEEGPLSRITVRMPERLKVQVDESAAEEGLSANAWLVRSAATAVQAAERRRRSASRRLGGDQKFQGWTS
ncbi:hypothetical protein ACIG5E_34495 [Kitasatospora sp. NPDC053057]|uniref:hypothetical protein n=1 Tax=Kitasatospora sp. NPDC053057 TaxID=3364062 RepID=UPI0037C89794